MVPYSNNQSSLDLILSRENKKTQMEKKKCTQKQYNFK